MNCIYLEATHNGYYCSYVERFMGQSVGHPGYGCPNNYAKCHWRKNLAEWQRLDLIEQFLG